MNDEILSGAPVRPAPRKKKPSDPKLSILLVQITACCVLLLTAFAIKFIGGDFYTAVREKYIEMFEDPTTVGEVLETAAGVFGGLTGTNQSSSDGNDSSQDSSGDSSEGTSDTTSEGSSDPALSDSPTSGMIPGIPQGEEEEDVANYVFDFNQVQTAMNMSGAKANTLLMPVSGTITSRFGYRTHPITGKYAMHGGLDIGAAYGTPISAAMAGVVKTVAQSNSYGLYVIINHQNGLETLYGHCSGIDVKEGDTVARGAQIARVGSTGISTGPHVHFEVRVQGVKLNPEWLLVAVGTT